MFPEGRWDIDISKLIRSMKRSRKLWNISCDYFAHCLDRDLLYSAVIVRKHIEDETIAKKEIAALQKEYPQFPDAPLRSLEIKIPVLRFDFVGEEPVIQQLCAEDYKHAQKEERSIKEICNWIIHSYVWRVAWDGRGFFVASDFDKARLIYYVDLDNYIRALEECFCK